MVVVLVVDHLAKSKSRTRTRSRLTTTRSTTRIAGG
jgi:hypothetical protein